MMTHHKQLLDQIAQKHRSIETLEIRRSDNLDFYEVSVWGVEAAFEAGRQSIPSKLAKGRRQS